MGRHHKSRTRSLFRALLVTPLAVASLASSATPAFAAATPEQVQATIDKGKQYIYSQLHDTNWETVPSRLEKEKGPDIKGGQWGGLTALCTYALLASGESPQEPRLIKAIEFLRTADLIGTYALGFRSQVWLNIPKNDQIKAAIDKDARLLLLARRTKGPNAGLYYYVPGPTGEVDHSCSQYGVLGLWACSDVVEGIPDNFWSESDQLWRRDQGDDGSWSYKGRPGTPGERGKPNVGTASMTAAGIATLFITQDFLFRGRGMTCQGNIVDKNLDAGLNWYSKFYKEHGQDKMDYYTFYGVERIGVASGYKYFGDVDWFRDGADAIVKLQKSDGSFPNREHTTTLEGTALALLFLSRGSAPVMLNKLNYDLDGKEANWNQRPRDAANLARWVGKQTENDLNWQITTMASPVADWHDSPILYMAGDQPLKFSDEQKAKLKQFVEEGGLIVANADCAKKDFADSFRKLGSQLFTNYEFKSLAASSPILHDEQYNAAKWRHPVPVLGLDNGARELMLLIPDTDPSKAWQMQQTVGKEELFQLAANIFLYSVDKDNLATKGQTYVVMPDPKIKASKTIEIQRIHYEGNDDPEPGSWKRMSAILHNNDRVDLTTTSVTPDKLSGKGIAHLTGTDAFKMSAENVAAIKKFVDGGGTLFVEACGGNTAFAESAERLIKSVFPEEGDQLKKPLPESSALYTTGGPLGEVTYRAYAKSVVSGLKGPQLRGITHGGRLVCIYSREDLSVGMVGEPVDGIIGYSPLTAANLVRKIVLYATDTKAIATGVTLTAPQQKADKKK